MDIFLKMVLYNASLYSVHLGADPPWQAKIKPFYLSPGHCKPQVPQADKKLY